MSWQSDTDVQVQNRQQPSEMMHCWVRTWVCDGASLKDLGVGVEASSQEGDELPSPSRCVCRRPEQAAGPDPVCNSGFLHA